MISRFFFLCRENDEGIEDMESDDDDNENAGTKYVIDKKTVEQRNMENNKDAQKRKVGVLSLVAPKGGHASIVDYIYDTGLSALNVLFSSNHNIHKSLCGLFVCTSVPLIERF